MPHTWKSLITHLSEIATQEYDRTIVCPCCGNKERTPKHGFYMRYSFDERTQVRIQRFRCDNDQCPRTTFSVLPHPFMRILRASLCMFQWVLSLWQNRQSVASIARNIGATWSRTQRWIGRALDIQKKLEYDFAFSVPPCLKPVREWSLFVRDFSHACYPVRCGR